MRVDIFQTSCVVAIGGKPDDAFFVEVQLEGSHGGDEHVDSHVPLGAFDQKRVHNVLLDDALLIIDEVGNVINN